MKIFFRYIVLVFVLNAAPAFADCGLSFSANDISIAWDLNFTNIAVQIRVDKANVDSCNFGIGITKGGAAAYTGRRGANGGNTLRYQLYKDNALSKTLKDSPDITSADDVITSGFQSGTGLSQNVLYYFEIPQSLATTPTFAAAGTFTDSFTLHLYEGSDPLAFSTPVATANVNVSISIAKMIALSIIDAGGGFALGSTSRNMNFGVLSEGASSNFDLRVRTNAGYSVTFSSVHDGRLRHTDPIKNSFVPFSLYVNGAKLTMSSSSGTPVVGLVGSGQTSTSGLAYPIKVVIGTVTGPGVLGGPHQDDITITATTTE